jgi:hypothetical protein
MSKYYTIVSMGMIGGSYFSKVHILKNEYKTKKEIFEKMKGLFENCTVFLHEESIWIIKSVLCGKTIESINNRLGECSFMIYDGEIFLGREVCGKCKKMVHKIIGACEENMFIPEDEKKNFFIKKKFLEYEEIPEEEIVAQLVWKRTIVGKNKEYMDFIKALKPSMGGGKTKDIQFSKKNAINIDAGDI